MDFKILNISDVKEREIPKIGYAYIEDAETGEQVLVNTSSKNFQKQYTKLIDEKIENNQKNMKKIGIDMINLNGEESFDISINRYFRNKWKMKN